MGEARSLSKVIRGELVQYDGERDVIFVARMDQDTSRLDRTQVDRPVDLCVEITTACNVTCLNCFSRSAAGVRGRFLDLHKVIERVIGMRRSLIRVSITGGEPFLHPDFFRLLELAETMSDLRFVVTTNGTTGSEHNVRLNSGQWLVCVSLHGPAGAHDAYSRSKTHSEVVERIERLVQDDVAVHIYSVLHDEMKTSDVDWLVTYHRGVGSRFLRFIVPRGFGRYRPLTNEGLLRHVRSLAAADVGLKVDPSLTWFLDAEGKLRMSN